MANLITGLDIGSAQIKCVVVEEKKDGSLSVIAVAKHPSAGFRKGILVDVDEATHVLRELAIDLSKISKRATHNVFVNLNGENIKPRQSRGSIVVSRADLEIQQEDIDRVLQNSKALKLTSNYLVLHNIPREYFVDEVGDIYNPLGMTGNRLEVSTLIIEAFAPQANLLLKTLERVSFKIGGVIFNPLAAARAVVSKKQKDLGVLMIDLGYGSTTMVAFDEGKVLHAKCFPIGTSHITNDIAVGLKTSIEAAEKIKLTYGFALAKEIGRKDVINLVEFDSSARGEVSRRFLAEIIEVRLAEIMDLVNNELKTLGRFGQLPGGAVITGGGVKLAGTTDLIRRELKLSAHIGLPDLSKFEILNPAHREMLDDPEFSIAVGLVFWSQHESQKLNGGGGRIKNFFRNLIP